MDLGLEGKSAWVLGGSSGLGFATAASLAREGCRVAISARNEDALKGAAATIGDRAVPIPCDASDAGSIDTAAAAVAEAVGDVDILIANAGGPPPGPFEAFDDAALLAAFELNALSAWRLCKHVVPGMRSRGSGCLLFITSSSTKEVIPGLLLSNIVRASVVGMMKSLSKELGPHGIRSLCVAPGTIETPRIDQLETATATATGKTREEVRAEAEERIPLGRLGRPEEFGDVVAFLASSRASYVNGITVLVDGGRSMSVLA